MNTFGFVASILFIEVTQDIWLRMNCLSFWEFFGVRSLNLSPSLTSLGKRLTMQNSNLSKSTNYMGHGFSQISKLPVDILEGHASPMVLFQVERLNSLFPAHSERIMECRDAYP